MDKTLFLSRVVCVVFILLFLRLENFDMYFLKYSYSVLVSHWREILILGVLASRGVARGVLGCP